MADRTNDATTTDTTKDEISVNDEISVEDLDEVAGGINPQPLPPMPRVAQ